MSNGGQAFPIEWHDGDAHFVQQGMTLRDWFAGLAMQAIVSKMPLGSVRPPAGGPKPDIEMDLETRLRVAAAVARGAYVQADAMLAERAPAIEHELGGES